MDVGRAPTTPQVSGCPRFLSRATEKSCPVCGGPPTIVLDPSSTTDAARPSRLEPPVDECHELLEDLVEPIEVGPPHLDDLPAQCPEPTPSARIVRLRGRGGVPAPALALHADEQVGDGEIESRQGVTSAVEHRVFVDRFDASQGECRACQTLEPTAGERSVDALAQQLEHDRRPGHPARTPLGRGRSHPLGRSSGPEHAVEGLAGGVCPVRGCDLQECHRLDHAPEAVDHHAVAVLEHHGAVHRRARRRADEVTVRRRDRDAHIGVVPVEAVEPGGRRMARDRVRPCSEQCSSDIACPRRRGARQPEHLAVDASPLPGAQVLADEAFGHADGAELAHGRQALLVGEQ